MRCVLVTEISVHSADTESAEERFAYRFAVNNSPTYYLFIRNSFVMKPQRDGGGHNVFGVDIPPTLKVRSNDPLAMV